MSKNKYQGAAGGWGALKSTTQHLLKSENVAKNIKTLLKTNQDHGFDCPGCAWGEKDEPGRFRFCENGAKAVNWEATSKVVDRHFFAKHSVSYLKRQSDYFLEYQGRLVEPLSYNPSTDHYEPISWQAAFELIARELNALESPNQAEFYTSGRASNEAAFLYQLFVRAFGTNNLPDCSNMCHEASGVALKRSIGIGKGTVTIEDFEHADAILVFGQNPGTNHPRMLDALSHASRRGARIVSINPLKERGLERFTNPQSASQMLTLSATKISSDYFRPKLGGDMAIVRGMVKALLAKHQQAVESGGQVFDITFIEQHTQGLASYLTQVEQTSWQAIIEQSGLSQTEIEQLAAIYQQADRVILTWAMGITQHQHSVVMIQEMANLQLLFGQIGKKGAGLCPVRGHSNVQGDRTMGINEKPDSAFLAAIEQQFNFKPPHQQGHNTVQAIDAMLANQSKVFIGLGGNFVSATPETQQTVQALTNCQLTVSIATKLNRTHVTPGKQSLILPCLGRTDIDRQHGIEQAITVEDSFSMVHASKGVIDNPHPQLKSEPAIIAGMAQATLGNFPVNWLELIADYQHIRTLIEQTIPGFNDFNQRLSQPGGFYLGNSAAQLNWQTPSGKAQFSSAALPSSLLPAFNEKNQLIFTMQTLRSHDQYNTTIYGFEDRYRGISGERNIVLINEKDIKRLGKQDGDIVDIVSLWTDQVERKVCGFKLVAYDIPRGQVACYFPEANPLIPRASVGRDSFTPTSKSVAVKIVDSQRLI
ncbi:FdhF/YdeP family oxidoreductase [Thalassotalea sp. LPB0316]|uniref:FdhF/YdeP family oxidoreductase n=1 Tax=Thalassotalea sp. LPB0316 TaxID=2769490 RepID=UPI00186760A9|nr:FdhF/YdeP family oxidoreductase [Thalassotalea sp. LPB0316]QOL26190.1 FdhF/YdeP family oxidoreductase [Thalassotalea sp. LPB0316]